MIESAKKLRHRLSKYFSFRMIVNKENLNYDQYLEFALSENTQALDKPNKKNNNKPRTLDYLFLRPNATTQGRHEFLHLSSNKIIICRKIWSTLVTKSITAQVEAITKRKNMPKGLKIKNKHRTTLFLQE